MRMHERAAVAYGDAREGNRSEGVREAIVSFARMRVATRSKRAEVGDAGDAQKTKRSPGCRRAQSRRYATAPSAHGAAAKAVNAPAIAQATGGHWCQGTRDIND